MNIVSRKQRLSCQINGKKIIIQTFVENNIINLMEN